MMELFKKYIAPALVAFFVAVLFILLRTSPTYKLWKGYTVLSVDANANQSIVNDVLLETGCGEVISLEAQRDDETFDFLPMLSLDYSDTYNKNKSLYFFDKDNRVAIYYIPDSNKAQAQKAVTLLNGNYRISASLDSHNNFPWLVPIVALIVFSVFAYYAENKTVFLLSGLFPVIFCFCNPLYADAAAVCLELYAFYYAQKVWRRRGGADFVLTNPYIWLFCFFAVACAFVAGFVSGVLFILNFCASISLLYILLNLQEEYESQFRFVPVLIRNAKMAGAMNLKTAKNMIFCSCGIFLLLILFLIGANFSGGNSKKGLFFPAPKEYNKNPNVFPSLEDYFARKWNSIAVQYRSLNDIEVGNGFSYMAYPVEGETVKKTRYIKDGGEIKVVENVLYTYNEAFRKDVVKNLKELDYPAVEKLWIEQGIKFSTAYTAGGGKSNDGGSSSAVALVVAMFLPLAAAFKFIFVWRRKRNAL